MSDQSTFQPKATVLVKSHSLAKEDPGYSSVVAMVGTVCVVMEDLGEQGVKIQIPKSKIGHVFARDEVVPCPRLTTAQWRVMHLMSKRWPARCANGAAVHINGQRICNIDTMTSLERYGLVERDPKYRDWNATPAGLALNLDYLRGYNVFQK